MEKFEKLVGKGQGPFESAKETVDRLKKEGYDLVRLKTKRDELYQVMYDFDFGEVVQMTRRIEIPKSKNEEWRTKKLPWAWFVILDSYRRCFDCD